MNRVTITELQNSAGCSPEDARKEPPERRDDPDSVMIDATHPKPTGQFQLCLKKDVPRHMWRIKGGLNSKLHAIVDEHGPALIMCLTAGQASDHIGARIVYPTLPEAARILIGDRILIGTRAMTVMTIARLSAKSITPCIPPHKGRKSPASYCKTLYSNAIRSKTCSQGSKIGGGSQHDMTVVLTPSSRPYSSQLS